MTFYVLTLFPEMVEQTLGVSILGRAQEKELIRLRTVNIRDFSDNRYGHVDGYPYGGGAGMLMQPGPVCRACDFVKEELGHCPRVLYMTPQGKPFTQHMAEELSKEEELVFLCGHYEGIDERALEREVTDYISLGDFVLTGGELPAICMIDCISRLVPGVLKNEESAEVETFHDNLLEYPQYTRPEEFEGMRVPEILLSGHHGNVEKWRREQSIRRTLALRPDLLKDANLSKKEKEFLLRLQAEQRFEEEEKDETGRKDGDA